MTMTPVEIEQRRRCVHTWEPAQIRVLETWWDAAKCAACGTTYLLTSLEEPLL